MYFGDVGHNAITLIRYFEQNGSRQCGPTENPYVISFSCVYLLKWVSRAEFMLDVIGAGATATSDKDWYEQVICIGL